MYILCIVCDAEGETVCVISIIMCASCALHLFCARKAKRRTGWRAPLPQVVHAEFSWVDDSDLIHMMKSDKNKDHEAICSSMTRSGGLVQR